jgi:N-acetylmuramic acid 6-phosphate etherase
MKESGNPLTEEINPLSVDIDEKSVVEILELVNQEDKKVAFAVEEVIPEIAKGVNIMENSIRNGGRIFYFGSGTSGRLGVLDAAELPVTFGVDPYLFKPVLAGGKNAMFTAKEGAEDSRAEGRRRVAKEKVGRNDVLIGITASGETPFVIGALQRAKERGACTLAVATNPEGQAKDFSDVYIAIRVGPEIIAGSTRMKSATAQKMVLNMMSTAAMIRLGKVYGNLMVDVRQANSKLKERSRRIISLSCGISDEEAEKFSRLAGGDTKLAIFMAKTGLARKEAELLLEKAGGYLKRALNLVKS